MKKIALWFYIVAIFSCSDSFKSEREIQKLKENILLKNDNYSISILYNEYLKQDKVHEALPYFIISSDKFNNSYSARLVYDVIIEMNKGKDDKFNFSKLGKESKQIALAYLLKACKLKDYESVAILQSLYKSGYLEDKKKIKIDSLEKVIRLIELEEFPPALRRK